MSLFLIVFMFGLWSSVFALSKLTLLECPPIFFTSARMLFAGVLLFGYLLIRKNWKIGKKDFLPLTLLALFSIYLTNALEFWGVQYLSAAKTCFIYSLSPIFAALFSYIHFKEKMNAKKWLGLAIGFTGFLPVLYLQTGSESLMSGISFISLPSLALMGAALCSVYGWVILRILVKDNTISPIKANCYSMLIGGLIALAHSFLIDTWHPFPVSVAGMPVFIRGTFLITFISNIVCYNLYGYLLKKYTATFMSFMGLLSPFFASINGWLILGETPSLTIFLSTAVVIFGQYIIYREELKQGYIKTAKS